MSLRENSISDIRTVCQDQVFKTIFFLTTADEIRTFYTLSPPLELCSAARGLGSRVTLGETDCVNYARLARAMWAATQ